MKSQLPFLESVLILLKWVRLCLCVFQGPFKRGRKSHYLMLEPFKMFLLGYLTPGERKGPLFRLFWHHRKSIWLRFQPILHLNCKQHFAIIGLITEMRQNLYGLCKISQVSLKNNFTLQSSGFLEQNWHRGRHILGGGEASLQIQ